MNCLYLLVHLFNMFKHLIFFIFILFLSSCISNRDIDIFISEDNTQLEVFDFDYVFSEGDLVSVEIKSLTPTKYDFLKNTNTNEDYRLQNNPYLSGYLISDSGYINLPVLGKVFIKGKTFSEAEAEIEKLAANYFVDPYVKLAHLNFNVTILGEVQFPGRYLFQNPHTTILEVIGEANGFTSVANRKKIKIIRTVGDKPTIFYLDLSKKSTSNTDLFYARRGDVITVEPYEKKFFAVNNISQLFSVLVSSFSLYFLLNQSE